MKPQSSLASLSGSWGILLLGLMLAGCAVPPGAAPEGRDRITASDETDAMKRGRVRLELASAYFGRGQLTTALDEVKMAIIADPTQPAAFNLRGLIYAGLGDDALAEESFRRAMQLDARDADVKQNFGWYLCQRQRFGEADQLFTQALATSQYRDSARTLLTQGVCQARAGELARAEETLQRAFEADSTNPATAVNLSEVLYRRGEFERARFHMRRVNAMPDVSNSQTLWLAARIENKLGNRQGVMSLGREMRQRFPSSPETLAFEAGRFDE